jgi:dTDP-4-dehydrorhamnose reductase
MTLLITGANGRLGSQIAQRISDATLRLVDLPELDISDFDAVQRYFAVHRPSTVIHCAAWTDVDGCATDPQRAVRMNGLGTGNLAVACATVGAEMLYISTNEVFDGTRTDRPYWEYDTPNPINPYAQSKYAGEVAARELVSRLYVVRVAWLFGGVRNFVRTVLRLADEQPSLRMVADEIGSPTYTVDVADAVARLIGTDLYGTYHVVNEGHCSRFELAQATLQAAGKADFPLYPMALAEYVRPSRVPPYTPLANVAGAAIGITLRPWQDAVAQFVHSLK